MIKAFVVDDEILAVEYLLRLLRNTDIESWGYSNPNEAFEMAAILKPDVLFLDIEMPEINGLELAEKLQSHGYEGEIVYTTAYSQYAIEAFQVNALDYLLKPIMKEAFQKTITRVMKRLHVAANKIRTDKGKKVYISLFGNLSMFIGEQKNPLRFITLKSAETLAYMLLQTGQKEVSKWKLIDAIWPDKDMEKGDINLRSTIFRLNKTLRENGVDISLSSTGQGYRLEIKETDIEVDAFLLENLALNTEEINATNVEDYERILFCYNDMLLDKVEGEWCNGLRHTFHSYFWKGAQKLLVYYENNNTDSLKILRLTGLMIHYEPYEDTIREYEVRLHYRIGGKKHAKKYYENYKLLMKEEMGIEISKPMDLIIGD